MIISSATVADEEEEQECERRELVEIGLNLTIR